MLSWNLQKEERNYCFYKISLTDTFKFKLSKKEKILRVHSMESSLDYGVKRLDEG
jgi:hypothetical protein